MKRTAALIASAALALSAGVAAAPAAQADSSLRGVWSGIGSGLASNEGRQVQAQARIAFKKVKGNTVVANYQWRSCADHAKQCKKGDLSGGGWSDKERLLFITDGATLIGVEDEASWLGRVNADGSVTLIFSEMQNARPEITPLILAYQLTRVS
jgi:hypothetical protein